MEASRRSSRCNGHAQLGMIATTSEPSRLLSLSLSAGPQQRRWLLFLVSVRTGYYLLCIVVCFVIVNI